MTIFSARSRAQLLALRKIRRDRTTTVIDTIKDDLGELFCVRNPAIAHSPDRDRAIKQSLATSEPKKGWNAYGSWAWYSWSRTLVHVLPANEHHELRTARNRNLITKNEQEKFRKAVIGIAGLSVGNSCALTIVLQGGGDHMRLADSDRLSLSNLNRIRAGVPMLGLPKTEVASRQIYEMNPYAKLKLFPDGLTMKNIKNFFLGPPKLGILVEEMDSLAMKIEARKWARKLHIPVVMAADDGDGVLLDVERFDLEPKRPLLHGRIPETLPKNMTRQEMGMFIGKHFIGEENIPERMKASLTEIGKTLYTWPQLGGAATLAGVVVASCVRHILTGEKLPSGRLVLSLDTLLKNL